MTAPGTNLDKTGTKGMTTTANKRNVTLGRCALAAALLGGAGTVQASDTNIAQTPLFLTQAVEPLVMLSLSNDHQLYFEAYNEYTDLTGDGVPDTTYTSDFEYYGYFDSNKCYDYSGDRFEPVGNNNDDYYCSGDWSGNFLNWLTMARIDTVRRMLYGGHRHIDEPGETVLERSYLPQDGHSWARYYDGDDIHRLTPYSGVEHDAPTTRGETATINITDYESRLADSSDYEVITLSGITGFEREPGDQIWLRSGTNTDSFLQGYFRGASGDSDEVVIQYARDNGGVGDEDTWEISNPGRIGISFCNTTRNDNGALSQNVEDPPLLRVAQGNYTFWGANERWQCTWADEETNMLAGGWGYGDDMSPNSNGNIGAITGINANTDYPRRHDVASGQYNVRVEVCREGMLEDNCEAYGDGNYKPEGLLQRFGGEDELLFGLMSGSYERNKSGGVLRRNISRFSEEIDAEDGTFTRPDDSIVDFMDGLRIYGYRHDNGTYHGGTGSDDCLWGLTDFDEGQCTNWGNPQSELFLEALRYMAGEEEPAYHWTSNGGQDRMGLSVADWEDPASDAEYCAPMNVIQFNASTNSYDADNLDPARDLPGLDNVDRWTDEVGSGEGIHGNDFFVGEAGGNADGVCSAKSVSALSDVLGICPDEPRLGGSYQIAGLAHYARTNDLRPAWEQQAQTARTYGVELAPAVPEISVVDGGTEVATLLPACREFRSGRTPAFGSCTIVDFKVIDQDPDAGTGRFFVQWEDSEQGGDYDMDMSGILEYEINGNSIDVSTRTFADSSNGEMGFGYVISGTDNDGFHVHSGIGGFSEGLCGNQTDGCERLDAATTKRYAAGGGSSAENLERPLYYAAKWGGYEDEPANGAPEEAETYFFATNPEELERSLADAFSGVLAETASAASLAQNSTEVRDGSRLFQARFDSDNWTGDLVAFELDSDDPMADPTQNIAWTAAAQIGQPEQRNIFTWDGDDERGIRFRANTLNDWQEDQLAVTVGDEPVSLEAMVAFLRGDDSDEGSPFRERGGPLGDIVHSDPALATNDDFGYSALQEHTGYGNFLDDKDDRTDVIYVGANDGMLHAFDADTGEHKFAYMPNSLFPELPRLAQPDYDNNHRFFVDGSPRIADAYFDRPRTGGRQWGTVLVGTLGRGGEGVFALDVSNPDNFGAQDVMWEFEHDSLGKSIGQPAVVKLDNGTWVALVHNGYDGGGHTPTLLVIDLDSGDLLAEIEADAGNGDGGLHGLSPVTVVDNAGDGRADGAYAGDLAGNVWRFDLTEGSNNWDGERLFQAVGPTGNQQPITAPPSVGRMPNGNPMVFVGTGRYLTNSDIDTDYEDAVQSIYGLVDDGTEIGGRNELQEQDIIDQQLLNGTIARATSDEPLGERGWYMDLLYNNNYDGERVVNRPLLRGRRLIVTTLIPSDHPCEFGGSGFLMELDAMTGSRPANAVLDVTGDGEYDTMTVTIIDDDGQEQEIEVAVSGMGMDGIPTQPVVQVDEDDPTDEYKYVGTSSGDVQVIKEDGAVSGARQSWRQLR